MLADDVVRVRLTKKLAEQIDGVSLDGYRVGDVMDLPAQEARLLVVEGWATAEERRRVQVPAPFERRRRESMSIEALDEEDDDRELAS